MNWLWIHEPRAHEVISWKPLRKRELLLVFRFGTRTVGAKRSRDGIRASDRKLIVKWIWLQRIHEPRAHEVISRPLTAPALSFERYINSPNITKSSKAWKLIKVLNYLYSSNTLCKPTTFLKKVSKSSDEIPQQREDNSDCTCANFPRKTPKQKNKFDKS